MARADCEGSRHANRNSQVTIRARTPTKQHPRVSHQSRWWVGPQPLTAQRGSRPPPPNRVAARGSSRNTVAVPTRISALARSSFCPTFGRSPDELLPRRKSYYAEPPTRLRFTSRLQRIRRGHSLERNLKSWVIRLQKAASARHSWVNNRKTRASPVASRINRQNVLAPARKTWFIRLQTPNSPNAPAVHPPKVDGGYRFSAVDPAPAADVVDFSADRSPKAGVVFDFRRLMRIGVAKVSSTLLTNRWKVGLWAEWHAIEATRWLAVFVTAGHERCVALQNPAAFEA